MEIPDRALSWLVWRQPMGCPISFRAPAGGAGVGLGFYFPENQPVLANRSIYNRCYHSVGDLTDDVVIGNMRCGADPVGMAFLYYRNSLADGQAGEALVTVGGGHQCGRWCGHGRCLAARDNQRNQDTH